MKKLLGIVVLGLLWCNVAFAGNYIGEGELQLTDRIARYFAYYIKGEGGKKPSVFYVTINGDDAVHWYCPETQCRPITPSEDIKTCERATNQKCKMFARGKYIKWKNGISPGKGKITKVDSRWNETQILAKLTELGFYKNSTTAKPKITKKKIEKKETKKIDSKKQKAKDECKELGFTKGTEKFGDCVMKMLSM